MVINIRNQFCIGCFFNGTYMCTCSTTCINNECFTKKDLKTIVRNNTVYSTENNK